MRLLNLKIDDLYLRGGYDKVQLQGKMKHHFIINLGFRDDNARNLVGNLLYLSSLDDTWVGTSEQSELSYNRYSTIPGGSDHPSILIDRSCEHKTNEHVLFTGVYSTDCKAIYPNIKIGITKDVLPKIRLLGYGLMPLAYTGNLYPNLALTLPDVLDYQINGHIYSGKTGLHKKTTKIKEWLTPLELLTWFKTNKPLLY